MADDITAAPAAPSTQSPPATPPESVQRLQSLPDDTGKPLVSLDDVLTQHFKDSIKEEPTKVDPPDPKSKDAPKVDPPAKQEPKVKPPAKQEPAPQAETRIIDPDTIKPHRELKGDALKGWDTLHKNNKRTYEENKKLAAKVKDLETVVAQKGGASQKEVEALKLQLEELRPYRQMVEIQHDPDFKKEYDEPIETAKKAVHKILKDLGTKDEIINLIDFTNPSQVDKVVGALEESGNKTLARRILAYSDDIQKVSDKRQEALANSKVKFQEFSKNREEGERTRKTEEDAVISQVIGESISAADKDGNAMFPFLQQQEIPATATKEQAEQIHKRNDMAEHLQNQIQVIVQANDPKSRALNAVRAVVGAVRDAQLQGALARIQELEQELGKISKAGSESRSTPTAGAPSKGVPLTTDEALDAAFPGRLKNL